MESRRDKRQLSFQQHLDIVCTAKIDWMNAGHCYINRQVDLTNENTTKKMKKGSYNSLQLNSKAGRHSDSFPQQLGTH